jgi:prophage DNA circulation protein
MATWIDRLREAAYKSPSGKRIKFLYEDVSREVTIRGTAFEFPGVNESYVQQMGNGPRRYPLRCCFSGPQSDLEATAFEAALLEHGTGLLEHPRYGNISVVPFGDIARRDDLKTAANQSVIEVTFWTTLGAIYPTNDAHPQNEVLAALGDFNVEAAQAFANATNLTTAANKAATKATIRGMLKQVGGAFDDASSGVSAVRGVVKDATDTINQGMDVLIGKPLLLAQQISNLIQSPARALAGLESRLDGYGRLFDSIFGTAAANPAERIDATSSLLSRRNRVANDFHSADLFSLNCVAGSIVAVSAQPLDENGRIVRTPIFTTKPQAIAAASQILDLLDDVIEWRDDAFDALGTLPAVGNDQLDTGGAYQAIKHAAALAAGMLVQTSFALVPERSITLDRARTLLDLAAELYGAVDSKLDFLIDTNNLTGSEILELPAGKKILYYAAA